MTFDVIVQQMNEYRTACGFFTVQETLQRIGSTNTLLDPFSTLISSSAHIGSGNIFYPGVIIEGLGEACISLGNNNRLYANTMILADGGQILIGDANQFGDGGLTIKANTPGSSITIGNGGRYLLGAQILGHSTVLGNGSQILGAITVQDCILTAGADYRNPDPDLRGGVLKGGGLARNLTIGQGEVLNGQVFFQAHQIQRQSFYHPQR